MTHNTRDVPMPTTYVITGHASDRDSAHSTYATTDKREAMETADSMLDTPGTRLVRIRLR